MNRISSRSHSVLTIYVAQKEKDNGVNSWLTVVSAKIQLVDLAGSELVGKSYLVGKQLEEAKMINKSLSALGLVIAALTSRSASSVHIPYRNSKLTRILQDSLGGTSKLSLIMTVSPSLKNANETLSTLRFGLRARVVQNKVVKNVHRVSSGGGNICSSSNSCSSSSSNSNSNSNSSSPSKYYGSIPMSRMSTGSLRDTPFKPANFFSGRISDAAMQTTSHRIDRRLDNHSVETLALNAQLDSIETTKILKSFSEEELLVDLACDGEYDIILCSSVRCESHDSDVLSTDFIKAACPMSSEKSMENLDLTVILAETNDTHMGYSPNSCFTPDGENAGDESGYTVFTPHSSKEQLAPDVTFLEPYLDTNLIYKCLDFHESIEPINTMTRSPTHALQMSKARNFERTSLNVDTGYIVKEFQRDITVPESKCYSFAEFQGIWKGSSLPEPEIPDPVSPAKNPISISAYGSFEGKNDDKNDDRSELKMNDELTTQLAKQLAVESIIVSAVTALLNVERETVAKLTKEIAILTKNGASSPIPLHSPVSTVMDRSIHADVEEEKLSLLLSQQLKAQNVQLRVLSQELLTQKIFASTVSEKLSRVQASSAGATMSLSSERAGVEVVIHLLREKILELTKQGNDKDILIASLLHNRNRITEKLDNNDNITLIHSPISVTSDHPDSWTPPCTDRKPSNGNDNLVTVTGDRSASTPGSMGPSDNTMQSKYVIKQPTAIASLALLGIRDENSPSRHKVLTVVAAIEQKCSSRPSSMRFEDKSSAAAHSSSDGKVHDRQPTLSNPTVSKLKADMQFLGLTNPKGKIAVAPWRMPRPALSRLHDITSRHPLTATRQAPVVVPSKRRQITVETVMVVEIVVVAEAEVKAINEIEVEAEAKAEAIEETEAEVEVEAEAEAEAIEESEAEVEVEAIQETDVETEIEAEAIEETEAESAAEVEAKVETDVEAEVEAQAVEEIESEAEAIEEIEVEVESKVIKEIELEAEVEAEAEAKVIEVIESEEEAKTTEETGGKAEAIEATEVEVEAGVWTEIGSASVSEAEAVAVIIEEIDVASTDVRIEAGGIVMDVETEENLNGISITANAEVSTKAVSVTPAYPDKADEQPKSNIIFTSSLQFNNHLRNMSRPPMIITSPVTPTSASTSTSSSTFISYSHSMSTTASTSTSNSPAAPTSSCSSISDSLSTSASTPVANPQSQPQPQPRSPVGRASAIPLRALNSPMPKMNLSKRQLLGDVIAPHATVKPMAAIAPAALIIQASATIIPEISVEKEDPTVVTVDLGVLSPVRRVVSFESTSDLDEIPSSDDIDDHLSLRNAPKQLLSSLSNSEEDVEEKDHIPEITLYHSGDSDTSMNLENVRDFIDHIPSSIPEMDDSFIGERNNRDQLLSQFKSTGSGKFAAEQL